MNHNSPAQSPAPLPAAPPASGAPAQRRRGSVLILTTAVVSMLLVFSLLTVDWGARQVAAEELQGAVDAATLYGVRGMSGGYVSAAYRVYYSLQQNPVHGKIVPWSSVKLTFGDWDPTRRTFLPLEGEARNAATALRLEVRLKGQDGVQTPFAALVGLGKMSVSAQATATLASAEDVDVGGKSCLFLAGLPNGSKVPFEFKKSVPDGRDTLAPECTPRQADVTVTPGQILHFRNLGGTTTDTGSGSTYGLDGHKSRVANQRPVNGINTTYAPQNALMGMFLDDRRPDVTPMKAEMDFSTRESRDFSRLKPELKQAFFIGDGVANDSNRLQQFVVPAGATRLFLGVSDGAGYWWDNDESYRMTVFHGNAKLVE